jgi:preprotein translocase subunit SecB
MATIQNAFRLVNTQVTQLQISTAPIDINNKAATAELDLEVAHHIGFSTTNQKEFFVVFQISLKSQVSSFALETTMLAFFLTQDDITAEFGQSDFLKISAPAIAFPFVRSFIATITANAGYDAVIFPPLNFVQ